MGEVRLVYRVGHGPAWGPLFSLWTGEQGHLLRRGAAVGELGRLLMRRRDSKWSSVGAGKGSVEAHGVQAPTCLGAAEGQAGTWHAVGSIQGRACASGHEGRTAPSASPLCLVFCSELQAHTWTPRQQTHKQVTQTRHADGSGQIVDRVRQTTHVLGPRVCVSSSSQGLEKMSTKWVSNHVMTPKWSSHSTTGGQSR